MSTEFSKIAEHVARHLNEESSSASFVEAGSTDAAYCAGGDCLNHSAVAEGLLVCELNICELEIVRNSQRQQE